MKMIRNCEIENETWLHITSHNIRNIREALGKGIMALLENFYKYYF